MYENWQELGGAVKSFFKENIAPKLNRIKVSWEKIKDVLKPVTDAVANFFKKFEVMDGIKKAFEAFGGLIFTTLTSVIAGGFTAVVGVIEGFVHVISGVVQIVGGVLDGIVAVNGDVILASLTETHAFAALEIYSWENDHNFCDER